MSDEYDGLVRRLMALGIVAAFFGDEATGAGDDKQQLPPRISRVETAHRLAITATTVFRRILHDLRPHRIQIDVSRLSP